MMRRSWPSGMIQPPARSGRANSSGLPFFGEMAANGLRLGVDSGANELVLDPDEDGPEIKAGECFLIGRLNAGVGKRSRAGDDSADKTVHGGACLVHIPHRGCVEQGARPLGLTLESSWK